MLRRLWTYPLIYLCVVLVFMILERHLVFRHDPEHLPKSIDHKVVQAIAADKLKQRIPRLIERPRALPLEWKQQAFCGVKYQARYGPPSAFGLQCCR